MKPDRIIISRRIGRWRFTVWNYWVRYEHGRHTFGSRTSFGPITIYGYEALR